MVIDCPLCRNEVSAPVGGPASQEWKCPSCRARFRITGPEIVPYGEWCISEASWRVRMVCPFCQQHYEALPRAETYPIDCTFCGNRFLVPGQVDQGAAAQSEAMQANEVVPCGTWCISASSGQLRVACPGCGQRYAPPPSASPFVIDCTFCGKRFVVPVRAEEAPPRPGAFPVPEPPAASADEPKAVSQAVRPGPAVVRPVKLVPGSRR